MELQVTADHYDFNKYITKKRWISYWHQIDEVISLSPDSVLEIGVGAGVFKNMMGSFGINIKTVDIDPDLKPDCVASVLDLPFEENEFDVVAAFQVLEHMPYEKFPMILSEMKRVAAHHIVISLPDAEIFWRYSFYIPKVGEKSLYIKRPTLGPVEHKFNGQHYWEISRKGYPLSRIINEFKSQGLELIKTYRVPENMKHRFFVLSTCKQGVPDNHNP